MHCCYAFNSEKKLRRSFQRQIVGVYPRRDCVNAVTFMSKNILSDDVWIVSSGIYRLFMQDLLISFVLLKKSLPVFKRGVFQIGTSKGSKKPITDTAVLTGDYKYFWFFGQISCLPFRFSKFWQELPLDQLLDVDSCSNIIIESRFLYVLVSGRENVATLEKYVSSI